MTSAEAQAALDAIHKEQIDAKAAFDLEVQDIITEQAKAIADAKKVMEDAQAAAESLAQSRTTSATAAYETTSLDLKKREGAANEDFIKARKFEESAEAASKLVDLATAHHAAMQKVRDLTPAPPDANDPQAKIIKTLSPEDQARADAELQIARVAERKLREAYDAALNTINNDHLSEIVEG